MRCLPRSTGTLGLASRLPRPRGWPRCPRLRPAPARRAGPAGPCRASSPGAIIMRTPRRRSTSSRPDTRGITARSRSRTGSGRRCCGRSTAQHYRRRGGPGRRSGGGADLPGRAATPAAGRSTSRTTGCTTPTTTSAGRPTASQALTGSRPASISSASSSSPPGSPTPRRARAPPAWPSCTSTASSSRAESSRSPRQSPSTPAGSPAAQPWIPDHPGLPGAGALPVHRHPAHRHHRPVRRPHHRHRHRQRDADGHGPQ